MRVLFSSHPLSVAGRWSEFQHTTIHRASAIDHHPDRIGTVHHWSLFDDSDFHFLQVSRLVPCVTVFHSLNLCRKLRRHFSQKSLLLLSINFLFVNILFALIDLYTRDQFKDLLCVVLASFLHYFVLSTFSWMLVLALIQYLSFVKVFPHAVSAFTRKAAAFAQRKWRCAMSGGLKSLSWVTAIRSTV